MMHRMRLRFLREINCRDGRARRGVYTRDMLARVALVSLIMLLSAAALARPARELPPDALRTSPLQQQLQHFDRHSTRLAGEWWTQLEQQGAEALVTGIERPRDRQAWPAFEQALELLLLRMRDAAPRAEWLPLLEHLAGFQSLVYQRHPETSGDWWLAVYPVAARALGTLEQWQAVLLAERAATLLRVSASDYLIEYGRLDGGSRRAWSSAIAAVGDDERQVLASALAAHPAADAGPLWIRLAAASGERAHFEAAVHTSHGAELVDLLNRSHRLLSTEDAWVFLQQLAGHPEHASLALQRIGDLVPQHPEARAWLLDRLGMEGSGASAAAALVRHPSEALVEALEQRLMKARTAGLQRDLLLALRLSGSARGAALVEAFIASPAAHAEIKAAAGVQP
jgi:hypothetical protein